MAAVRLNVNIGHFTVVWRVLHADDAIVRGARSTPGLPSPLMPFHGLVLGERHCGGGIDM